MVKWIKGVRSWVFIKRPSIIIPEVVSNDFTLAIKGDGFLKFWQQVVDACIYKRNKRRDDLIA